MKTIINYITESNIDEFNYASEGDHDFIDEIIEYIESKGFKNSEKKVLKQKEYKITNNGYELFIRSEERHHSTRLVCIRKGENNKYDYYYKSSNDSHWIFTIHPKDFSGYRYRKYQYYSNGIFDVTNEKTHDRLFASIRGTLYIPKKK